MTNLTPRLFQDFTDLQAMVALCQSLRQKGQVIYPIAADLYEELADPAVQASARLWVDDHQQLVGFAYVNHYQNLVDAFDAAWLSPEMEPELVAWALSAVKQRNIAHDENQILDASALETDLTRIEFLQRQGFERQPEISLLFARPLDMEIPEPHLPAGFVIRPMQGEAEIEAYVSLHRAAFGSGNMTADYRLAILHAPDYISELDLVAVAPDGRLAAFCVCQIFPDDLPRAGGSKEGWTDPVGTHPVYQRQGLAKALLLTGIRRLQARGIDTALLGTSSTNLRMRSLASSAGFRKVSTTLWFTKELITK